jgi:hypothetical protein
MSQQKVIPKPSADSFAVGRRQNPQKGKSFEESFLRIGRIFLGFEFKSSFLK